MAPGKTQLDQVTAPNRRLASRARDSELIAEHKDLKLLALVGAQPQR
jgi:hypothetical protein